MSSRLLSISQNTHSYISTPDKNEEQMEDEEHEHFWR